MRTRGSNNKKKEASKTKNERSNIDVREALPINDTAPPHVVGIGGREGGLPKVTPPSPLRAAATYSHMLSEVHARGVTGTSQNVSIFIVCTNVHTHTHTFERIWESEKKNLYV